MALLESSPSYYLSFIFIVFSLQVSLSSPYTSFVFGDSLVDAGNNDYIFTLSKADSPPYGIDFAASGGLPTGRFTNGRTISDIVGQALGAKSFPPPFLAPKTGRFGIINGVNYASGASGILDETGYLFVGRVPLRKQIDYFEQSKDYMRTMMGESGVMKLLKGTIFSLTIGSNDFFDYLEPSIPLIGQSKLSYTMLQDAMVSNLTLQLQRLHNLGARKFVVVGVGPLGCIPFVRALNLLPTGRCSSDVNDLVQGYNKKLRKMLYQLNEELGPSVVFVYANSFDIVMGIISHYQQYGFENAYDPCCGGNFPPFICFKGRTEDTSSVLCNDRSKYVFWDAYHPTEAANVIIAEKLLDGDQSFISPMNIRELYHYRS